MSSLDGSHNKTVNDSSHTEIDLSPSESVLHAPWADMKKDNSDLVGLRFKHDDMPKGCQKGCTVDGITYSDPFKIPGNEPTSLLHSDGSPVVGPDGKAIQGPSRAVSRMESIAKQFAENPALAQFKFAHGQEWDMQRQALDNGSVFTGEYRDFANVIIGYAGAAAHRSAADTAAVANFYCQALTFTGCSFPVNESASPEYPGLSKRLIEDYEIGYKLWTERHGTDAARFVR